ncbi:MAG: 30S ribosomal protein S21 [Planctomycetes bacterium]|nr:30S ribosomal protein S21 [Planctomycetota bacterium]
MIRIQVRPNEPLETALRRFKRQCNYAGIFRLAKKTTVYEKPSEKRRREDRERVRNVQRAVRKSMTTRKVRRKGFKSRGGADETSAVPVNPTASQGNEGGVRINVGSSEQKSPENTTSTVTSTTGDN